MRKSQRPNLSGTSFAPRILLHSVTTLVLVCSPAGRGLCDELSQTDISEVTPRFFAEQFRPFVEQHCVGCHGGSEPEAGMALDSYADLPALLGDRGVWNRIRMNLRFGAMPPDDQARPSIDEVRAILHWMDEQSALADRDAPRQPGRVTLRRLNRAEYNNTIRDLVGVDFEPAADFPSDDVGYGFDNIGDVLSVAPVLMEKYLLAAEGVMQKAIIDPRAPEPSLVHIEAEQLPNRAGGEPNNTSRGLYSEGAIQLDLPVSATGEYVLRVWAYGDQAGGELCRMALKLDKQDLMECEVAAVADAPMMFETRQRIEAGEHALTVTFLNDYYRPDAPESEGRDRNLYVDRFEVEGPFGAAAPEIPPSQREIIFREPTEETRDECLRAILERFASRAYRRPATSEEVDRLADLASRSIAAGDRFEEAVRLACTAVLVSPNFLFLIEQDPGDIKPGDIYAISEYELATRLSYFLWSSMPDEALLAEAAAGTLRQPGHLESQCRRMLADKKSQALIDNFAGQWLQLRNLQTATPDPQRFPDFDEELREAMIRESQLCFETVMREDRSVLEFLDADYTFVNERLARHYGIPDVQGPDFRRVILADHKRGGLLTQASVLTVTSNPTRTSPVKRGKWVLEELFAAAPPPPPPDVTPLVEAGAAAEAASLRERLLLHRADAGCASCHNRMDPLGFGLENFDAIGAWRDSEGEQAIDASGELPNGESFHGPEALKQVLLAHQDDFCRCLAEKMLTYALGRGLEETDSYTVDRIARTVSQHGYRFTSLVLAIVESDPFQLRTTMAAQ